MRDRPSVLLCLTTLMICGTLRKRLPAITQYPNTTASTLLKLRLLAAVAAAEAEEMAVAGSANARLALGGFSRPAWFALDELRR